MTSGSMDTTTARIRPGMILALVCGDTAGWSRPRH
jgi:hypothetical protein